MLFKKDTLYNIRENRGLLRNLICRTSQLGETMIIVCFGENKKDHIEQIMGAISKRFIDLDALHYVINEKGNDSIHDLEVYHYKGKIYIEESLNEMVLKFAQKVFSNKYFSGFKTIRKGKEPMPR